MAEVHPLQTVAVVVVNFGSHDTVEENLTQSVGSDFPGQVIVVDNFSTHDERDAMAQVCTAHGWDLIAVPDNRGFGGGNNLGVAHAIARGATELLLLNPDAGLSRTTIESMQRQVQADSRLQIAPLIRRPDGTIFGAEVDLHLATGEMRATRFRPADVSAAEVHTWVSGACFMMSAELWDRIGGFDDEYFLYWEDADLSRRVVAAGGRVRCDETLEAFHDEGVTHREGPAGRVKSPTYYYFNTRNRLLYAAKHLSDSDGRRWVRKTPFASYRILLQGGRRQFVRPGRNIWPVLRGSIDGVRLWRRHRRGRADGAVGGPVANGTSSVGDARRTSGGNE